MLSMSLAPETYLAMANGTPIDAPSEQRMRSVDIPTSGVYEVPASADGATSLAWIRSVVVPSRQRDAVIQALEEGRIPTLVRTSHDQSPITRTYYLSLDELQSRGIALIEILGLTEALTELAWKSRAARCHSCGLINPTFTTASEFVEEISRAWRGRSIRVDLRGEQEEIDAWAQDLGLRGRTASDGASVVHIDAFECDDSRCRDIQSLIGTTKRLRQSWIEVHDATERAEYSWHGRCPSCRTQNAPFRRALAREALRRGEPERAPVEMSRLIGGLPLLEMIRLPLARLITLPEIAGLLLPTQKVAISLPGIASLTLADLSSSLPPHTLAFISLLSHAGQTGDAGDLFLIDPPANLLSVAEEQSLNSVAQGLAANAPLIWLRAQVTAPSPFTIEIPTTPPLGTLTIRGASTRAIEIRRGEWRTVVVSSSDSHKRPAPLVATALLGEPNDLFEFSSASPFSAHFIPLLSNDSNLSRLVAHDLGVMEPLTKLFASSQQAKMLGLSARELVIGQARQSPFVCGVCKGIGLIPDEEGSLLAGMSPCSSCLGARFASPARDVTFKGATLWHILNSPIRQTVSILRALPKMSNIIEMATLLDLLDIPLGMPTCLLPRTTRRFLSCVKAILSGTPTRPTIIMIEEPYVGVTDRHLSGLRDTVTLPFCAARATWLGIQSR